MEVVVILSAVISLVGLIVFFVMAGNVSKMLKKISEILFILRDDDISAENLLKMAERQMYIGNKGKAKEYLLRAKYCYEVEHENYYSVNSQGYRHWADSKEIIDEIDKKVAAL